MIDFKSIQDKYELNIFPKRDIVLVKGKNSKVWDENGKEYIDCISGHGVANIGHCNDKVIEAIEQQAKKLITCPGSFYNDTRALLMQKLISISPKSLNKVYLCNSGAEANEAAIKFSRYSLKKPNFICAMRGFHGRTMGALSATFNTNFRKDFEPLVPGFTFVPFNNIQKLNNAIDEKTVGVILEIVQGEGGVNIGEKDYFLQAQELCIKKGVLLIIDEVQTGFCRTGKMFASDYFDLQPDIMCLAKAIAGGLPMGAVLCSDKVSIDVGKHGSTFSGGPLVCAAANAAIDFMVDNKLSETAKDKGEYIIKKLEKKNLLKIREIRYLGLLIGIELREKVKPYILKLMEAGVLTLPAGATVLRLLPPLTISYEELDVVAERVIEVLE